MPSASKRAAIVAEYVEETFATRNIDPFARGVPKQIVGVAADGEVREGLACLCVDDDGSGWLATTDKKAVIGFVERHREVGAEFLHWPGRDHCPFLAIHDGDVLCVGHVHENPRAVLLQLK